MHVDVRQMSAGVWAGVSAAAFGFVFGATNASERPSYALVVFEEETVVGFITVIEENAKVAYWCYGGLCPDKRGGLVGFRALQACVAWCQERYEVITTRVENTNIPMLRMAMRVGFLVKGIRYWNDRILLEMHLEGMETS